MKQILLMLVFLVGLTHRAQNPAEMPSRVNARLSFLVVPFSPLLSLEISVVKRLTLQVETNFKNTHGLNMKYYLQNRMQTHYVFVGTAFMQHPELGNKGELALLPYAGYGYALRFGNSRRWIFDSRLGLGALRLDGRLSPFPVLKSGIGITY